MRVFVIYKELKCELGRRRVESGEELAGHVLVECRDLRSGLRPWDPCAGGVLHIVTFKSSRGAVLHHRAAAFESSHASISCSSQAVQPTLILIGRGNRPAADRRQTVAALRPVFSTTS